MTTRDKSNERRRGKAPASGSVVSSDADNEPVLGPAGGRTTVSRRGDLIRKTFFIDWDVEEELRREAFETRRTEADIVREALRWRYRRSAEPPAAEGSARGKAKRRGRPSSSR